MRSSRSLAAVPALFSAPSRAFQTIRDTGGWAGAFLLGLALLAAAFAVQLPQTLRYQEEVTRATMEKLDLPEEEIDAAIRSIPDPARLSAGDFAMQVLLPTLVAAPAFFLGALLFHVLASAFGAEPRFSQTLGLFSLAHLASAAGALAKGALVRASDTIEVTLGPGALVPGVPFESGLGIFLDLFDVFSILNAVLLAIGARVVYDVTSRSSSAIAGTYWTLKAVVVFLLRMTQAWFTGG
jgi:hypothetical protein